MYIDANYDVIFTNNLLKGYSTLRLDGMHAKQSKAMQSNTKLGLILLSVTYSTNLSNVGGINLPLPINVVLCKVKTATYLKLKIPKYLPICCFMQLRIENLFQDKRRTIFKIINGSCSLKNTYIFFLIGPFCL